MDSLITYPYGTDQPGVEFKCANGYVSRCVSAIADVNIPDAEWACKVLNTYGHLVKHGADVPVQHGTLALGNRLERLKEARKGLTLEQQNAFAHALCGAIVAYPNETMFEIALEAARAVAVAAQDVRKANCNVCGGVTTHTADCALREKEPRR